MSSDIFENINLRFVLCSRRLENYNILFQAHFKTATKPGSCIPTILKETVSSVLELRPKRMERGNLKHIFLEKVMFQIQNLKTFFNFWDRHLYFDTYWYI